MPRVGNGIRITGANKVINRLQAMSLKMQKEAKVDVGYRVSYAAFVHENLENAHGEVFNVKYAKDIAAGITHARRPQEQAKFLEVTARTESKNISKIIHTTLKNKKSLASALQKAGEYLLDRSNEIVPIDTGALRDSGFVKVV